MSFISGMFGDNSGAFDDYAQQMRNQAAMYNPWITTGQQGTQNAYNEYGRAIANPNFLQDQVAGGFYMSPYQNLMQQRVQDRMNINAANTGMLGSGAANRALQDELTAMTGQFMNDYITRGMGTYNQGVQGMFNTGVQGKGALDSSSMLQKEAAMGDLKADQSSAGWLPNAIGTIGGVASMFPGVGSTVGNAMKGISGYMQGQGSTYNVGR